MTVDLLGLTRDRALAARIRRRLTAALGRWRPGPVSARVAFTDEDGPRGGPALRCAITVRLPYRRSIRVERVAASRREAFDVAFDSLDRRLAESRRLQRERRRRPRKDAAARRVLA